MLSRLFNSPVLVLLMTTVTVSATESGRALFFGYADNMPAATVVGVPQKSMSCAACHGRNAGGDREGSVRIPAIDGESLRASTSRRSAFDKDSFFAAVARGVTPDGKLLSLAMPRFSLSREQSAALWTYLDNAKNEDKTGITPRSITFAVVSESSTQASADATALRDAWRERGAPMIHGRTLEFESYSSSQLDVAAFHTAAFVGARIGNNGELLASMQRAGVPSIAPRVERSINENDDVLLVASDEEQIARALIALADQRTAIVVDGLEHKPVIRKAMQDGRAHDAKVVVPASADRIVLLTSDIGTGEFLDNNRSLRGRLVILPRHIASLNLIATLVERGASVQEARPGPATDPTFARNLAALLERVLVNAGRQVTRRRFVETIRKDQAFYRELLWGASGQPVTMSPVRFPSR